MSTDRKRLTSAIQRIAREDPEIRNLLGESENKGGKAASSGVGTSEAASEEIESCCGGGTSVRNPGDEDAGQDGLDPDDPANLDMGGGSLTGLTDCATGAPVCFEGNDWVPPDGWDDPQLPPLDETWQSGYSWSSDDGVWSAISHVNCWGPDCCLFCSGDIEPYATDADGNPTGYRKSAFCKDAGGCDGQATVVRVEDSDNTDQPRIANAKWPEDGCTNLAIKNGAIVGSKYDPENDGSYSKPRSEIQLCDANGNQISMRPAGTGVLPTGEQTSVPERITGGWKTFNSTTSNGYLYDSSGTQIAHIDGNEYSDPNI